MLINSTWILTTDNTTVLPKTYYIEMVKILHDKMGLELGDREIPSVSFSGLIGKYTRSKDFFSFNAGEFYQLHLAGLSEKSSQAIASLELPQSWEFLGTKFNVIERKDEITSYEEIYNNIVATDPEPIREFKLEFVNPCAFSCHKSHLPLPVPELMFRSWLEKWNYFAPVYLGKDELVEYLTNGVKMKHLTLKSRNYHLAQGYITGFTGNIILYFPFRVEPLLANVAHLLIKYATFAGTGVKTRLGMGHTILVKNEKT